MDAPAAVNTPMNGRPAIAERLWEAARVEFSLRGYHGARVQGIARRAGCNVALIYRHWASKRALYQELIASIWRRRADHLTQAMQRGGGATALVEAYLDASLGDPVGAQILIREMLDGAPFLAQTVADDAAAMAPFHAAAAALAGSGTDALRPGIDPQMALLCIGGLTALVSSAHHAARPFLAGEAPLEAWRSQVQEILLRGLQPCEPGPGAGGAGSR